MDPCVCVCVCVHRARLKIGARSVSASLLYNSKTRGKKKSFPTVFENSFLTFFFFFLSFPFATRFDILRLAFFPFLSNDLSTDPFFFYNSRAFPIQGGGGWKRPSLFPFLHESRWKLKGCLGGAVEGDVPWSTDRLSPKSRRESSSNSLRKVDLQRLNIISRYYFTLYRFDPRYTLLSLNDYTEIGGERKIAILITDCYTTVPYEAREKSLIPRCYCQTVTGT